jgi:hypothetical protein
MLAGYITTLMAYCAVTGEGAVGQPYGFCNDVRVNAKFSFANYVKSYYTAEITTNFPEVFASEGDMRGIQELIDRYIAKKDILKLLISDFLNSIDILFSL